MRAGKGLRKPDEIEPLCYMWRAYKKGHPPPVAERQEPFIPIIFRAKKVEKSSPQENIIFRAKNTEKSRLGLIGKNFGKNLWKNVSGKRKAPNLVDRGRCAKIRKSVFVGKDSVIIRDCKRRVLSFCFRTIEPCLCLAGRCLYVLPSFGT